MCGGGERRTLRIAARYGGGWNVAYVSPQLYRHKFETLDRWCESEGRDPAEITRTVNVGFHMGVTEAEARRKRQQYMNSYGSRAAQQEDGMLFGKPNEVVERVGDYLVSGAEGLNIVMRAPFDWDALHRFVEDVIPCFN